MNKSRMVNSVAEVFTKQIEEISPPRAAMMNVAMMGPALHATFMDVDRTLHHVPNSVGENHCKIWRSGSRPIHIERKRKQKFFFNVYRLFFYLFASMIFIIFASSFA